MAAVTYQQRRGQLETYFDRTAVAAWARLTSDAPVGRIRATVRAGRDDMRATLLDWLPADLHGKRLLDAGCGTGALALEAARRGAHVVAIDLSATLVGLARERAAGRIGDGVVDYRVGDMFDPRLGEFDHVVAMDSLIHYPAPDIARVVAGFASRTGASVLFTFAPKTAMLTAMHAVGRLFPRGDRAPAIEPVRQTHLHRLLSTEAGLGDWIPRRTARIESGFYKSQAQELVRL
jgi:magnesium-protoporphyrin O-methyltransferase